MTQVVTRSTDGATWSVDPADGGRLTSLLVDGQELIAQRGEVLVPPEALIYAYGAYPMVPWAGRIRDGLLEVNGRDYQLPTGSDGHAMHGTTYDRPWDIRQLDADGVVLGTDLGPDWPFAGEASMTWRSTGGGLQLRLSVLAHERMPVWVGVHPWFRRRLDDGRTVELSFDAKEMYLRGPNGLPTGERVPVPPGPWDDCFSGVSAARVRWDDLEIVVTASTDTWVIYDERPEALCAEPQTGPPDAVRLGEATWLDAGDEHVLDVDFRWHRTR